MTVSNSSKKALPREPRRPTIGAAVVSTGVARVAAMGIAFLADILLARTLGVDARGVYAAGVIAANLIVQLTDLGASNTSMYLASRRPTASVEIARESFWLSLFGALFGAATVVLVKSTGPFLKELAGWEMVAGTALLAFAISLSGKLNAIHMGRGAVSFANRTYLLQVATVLCSFAILAAANGLTPRTALIGQAAGIATVYVIAVAPVRFRLFRRPTTPLLLSERRFATSSYLANITSFVGYRLDQFVILGVLGAPALGLYAVAASLSERLTLAAGTVATVLMPEVASSPAAGAARTARLARLIFALVTGATLPVVLLGREVLGVLYGSEFRAAYLSLVMLMPGIAALSVAKILAADLSGRGKPSHAFRSSLLAAGLAVGLDALLVPRWGIEGAAAASTLAYSSSAAYLAVAFAKETGSLVQDVFVVQFADLSAIQRQLGRGKKGVNSSKVNG